MQWLGHFRQGPICLFNQQILDLRVDLIQKPSEGPRLFLGRNALLHQPSPQPPAGQSPLAAPPHLTAVTVKAAELASDD